MTGDYYGYVKTTDGTTRKGHWRLDTYVGHPFVTNDKGTIIPISSVIAMGDVFADVRGYK